MYVCGIWKIIVLFIGLLFTPIMWLIIFCDPLINNNTLCSPNILLPILSSNHLVVMLVCPTYCNWQINLGHHLHRRSPVSMATVDMSVMLRVWAKDILMRWPFSETTQVNWATSTQHIYRYFYFSVLQTCQTHVGYWSHAGNSLLKLYKASKSKGQ